MEYKKIIVDRHKVDTGKPIRALGEFPVTIKLTPDVSATIQVIVEAE